MSKLIEYIKSLFQLDSILGIAMLLVLVLMLVATVYSLNLHKQIASNGKVVATRKLSLGFRRIIPTGTNSGKKRKPFTRHQKRILRILYSWHGALFGLIIFAFGLGLVSKVYFDLASGAQQIFGPMMLVSALLGILAMPIGVLLIYFRDMNNPFDEN